MAAMIMVRSEIELKTSKAGPGTICQVLETGKVYLCGDKNIWYPLNPDGTCDYPPIYPKEEKVFIEI